MTTPNTGGAHPAPQRPPKPGHPLRYAPCKPARCPACNSKRIKITGHCPTGDESVTRYAKCKEPNCGWKFLTIEVDDEDEWPE